MIVFSNQLANLVESGVPLLSGLDLMAEEVSSKPLQKVLHQVLEDIRQGSSISAALAKHELVFPPIYQSMIQVGERTGNLGGVFCDSWRSIWKKNPHQIQDQGCHGLSRPGPGTGIWCYYSAA